MKPVVIDLCCGLGGWSRAFIAEGWDAIGFDIEKHQYGSKAYPGHLILADVLTLNGYDMAAARPSLVVASPPCQKYSYMAMPFSRGKAIAAHYRANPQLIESELNALYRACFRIARELEVPVVLENVKGAQPWVGRAKANYGSYYLWGDLPALMPYGDQFKGDGGAWFNDYKSRPNRESIYRLSATSSKSAARKEKSAIIAEIPF
jgi:site-specific DNA-cytosine methylase